MPALRTIMIGLGRIAYLLEGDPLRSKPCSHAGTLRALNRKRKRAAFRIVGACDHKQERIADFQKWWGEEIDASGTDAERLLKQLEGRFDLVIVATHTDSHCAIAKKAMECGARAVVIEKPVSAKAKDVTELIRKANKSQCLVWTNFERRYHPAYRFARRCVESRRYGELRSIRGRVLTWPAHPEATTGPLLHDAVHWIDLLHWYAGPPSKTCARMFPDPANSELDLHTYARFDYPHFCATLEAGGAREYFEFRMELDFERGRIVAGNDGHKHFVAKRSKKYRQFRDLQAVSVKIPGENESAWENLYREVLRLTGKSASTPFNNLQPEITTPLADSAHGLKAIADCYRSI